MYICGSLMHPLIGSLQNFSATTTYTPGFALTGITPHATWSSLYRVLASSITYANHSQKVFRCRRPRNLTPSALQTTKQYGSLSCQSCQSSSDSFHKNSSGSDACLREFTQKALL